MTRGLLACGILATVAAFRGAKIQRPRSAAQLRALRSADGNCEWAKDRYGDGFKDTVSDASTTAAVLKDLWAGVTELLADKEGTETSLIRFPSAGELSGPATLAALLEHLEDCKDVCDRFGSEIYAIGHHPVEYKDRLSSVIIELRRPQKSDGAAGGMFWEDGDAAADEWDDWNDEETDGTGPVGSNPAYAQGGRLDSDSLSDGDLVTINKEWVQAVVAGLGVCPFATSADRAGLPLGEVYYPVERAADAEAMYATFWSEVVRVQESQERALSTTMLVTPKFCLATADGFDAFANTLTKALEPLALDEGPLGVQLVFFHPAYEFRDGADRMDAGVSDVTAARDAAAGNFARRSPHPMINILRTPQVRAAQRVIPTGAVYVQNQRTLGQVGTDKLQEMLEEGAWEGLAGFKVDRRQGLWKKAATVTAAVEAAQGSRDGLERFEFDGSDDFEVSDPEALFMNEEDDEGSHAEESGSELGEGEEPLDLGELQNLVFATSQAEATGMQAQDAPRPEVMQTEAEAAPVDAEAKPDEQVAAEREMDESPPAAEAPPSASPPQPRADPYETALSPEDDPNYIAAEQRARAEAVGSDLTRAQREELSWMIELLQRRVSVSQGNMETLRLRSALKVTPETVQRFVESAQQVMREARIYDETHPDPRKQ